MKQRRLLGIRETSKMVALSWPRIHDKERRGDFPQRVITGASYGYVEDEVRAWMDIATTDSATTTHCHTRAGGGFDLIRRHAFDIQEWWFGDSRLSPDLATALSKEVTSIVEAIVGGEGTLELDLPYLWPSRRSDGKNGPPVRHPLTLDIDISLDGESADVTHRYRLDLMLDGLLDDIYDGREKDTVIAARMRDILDALRSLADRIEAALRASQPAPNIPLPGNSNPAAKSDGS